MRTVTQNRKEYNIPGKIVGVLKEQMEKQSNAWPVY
jgi:hypothetical protein